MSISAILYLAGMALFFVGERLLGDVTGARVGVDAVALALLLFSLWLRYRDLRGAEGAARGARRRALGFALVGRGSLVLYGLSLPGVADALHLSDAAAGRYTTILGSLWPIVFLLGTVPLLLLDRAASESPVVMQPRRAGHAQNAGLVLALAVCLAFPVNYLAAKHFHHFDLRYLKTTSPGTSTQALVESLDHPVKAVLFYPPANDVEARLEPYFQALAAKAKTFTVQRADHDLDPALSKRLKVSSNGVVALVEGTKVERIDTGTDLDGARSILEKLDKTVQTRLLRLTREARVVYFTVGHGELQWTGKASPLRKIAELKQVLEALNYTVKTLSVNEGLGNQIPSDAAVVVVDGPTRAFLPEEIAALKRYVAGGGHLMLMLDPTAHVDPPLDAVAGVTFHPEVLLNEKAFIRRSHTPEDFALMLTNRYGTQASMTTLSRLSFRLVMITPFSGWLEPTKAGLHLDPTVQSMPGTWADANGNHAFDTGETRKTFTLALAGAGEGKTPARVAVLASSAALSDAVLRNRANYQYAMDTFRWLAGDDALSGTIDNEQDVRIRLSGTRDKVWFYGTVFVVPLLILGMGLFRVSRRRRSA